MNKSIGEKLVKPRRLSDEVAEILRAEIEKGTLKPGRKLPSEMELAQNFDVSRTVIREALSRLKYDGLLDSRQGSGAIIAEREMRQSFRLSSTGDFTKKDFQHLMEMRVIVESQTAFLAAQRRVKADLNRLRSDLEDMNRALQDTQEKDGTDPDLQFHLEIARATQNPYLAEFLQYINAKLKKIIQVSRKKAGSLPGASEKVQAEHQSIYDAIAAKQAWSARNSMVLHISNTAKGMGLKIGNLILADPDQPKGAENR